MKRCIKYFLTTRLMLTIMFSAVVVNGGAFAQTVDDVLTADAKRLQLAQASQERINETVDGTRTLTDQYRAINKEIDGLKVYNRLMTAQVQGQEATLEDIKISMDQVDVINRQIFPLMERMIDGLVRELIQEGRIAKYSFSTSGGRKWLGTTVGVMSRGEYEATTARDNI